MLKSVIKKLVFMQLLFFILPNAGFCQNNYPEELFNRGLILYRNGDYEQAKASFQKLSSIKENNPRETIALLLLAKSYLHLEEYENAIRAAGNLIEAHPASRYVAHAFYVRAGSYFNLGDFNSALENFAFTVEFSTSAELTRLAESAATTLVDNSISLKKIENLAQRYPWDKSRPILTIWRAHLKYENGDIGAANQLLEEFLAAKPPARYATIAEQLIKKEVPNAAPPVRIGIVQPVSGYFSEEAQDFLRGCAFALKRRPAGGAEIALVLKDTRGEIVETIHATFALMDADVALVISELEGQKAAITAALLKTSAIPVVIPVATDNNLTLISDDVFQFNNDIEKRGAALADYAMNTLKMRTFATLAPADENGNAITDAFANKVDQLGGKIVAQQWYYPGTTDFSGQLEAIRAAGFRSTYRDSLRTLGKDGSLTQVDSMYAKFDRYARRNSERNESLAKYTDLSLRSIDGFFVPAYEEDIPFIASQFALYNIKSGLLGGDAWNDPELLRQQQRYVNGLVYVAGFYLSETDLDYINFTRDFRMSTATSPGAMALYGYNVMNLIIAAIDAGNTTGKAIAEYMKNVDGFEGLGTRIYLNNERRVNSYVNILQFQDGLIQRMNESE